MPKKYAYVKVNHEDRAQKIEATRVQKDEQYHRLLVYKGDEFVGDFPLDQIERWSLVDE